MSDTTEKNLMDALAYANCAKLPRAVNIIKDQSRVWIRAIAVVSNVTGAKTYAIVKNNYGRKPKFIKIFGDGAAIAKTVSIHPYEWLKPEAIPTFKNEQERDAFIARAYNTTADKVSGLSKEDKDRLLYTRLMDAQDAYSKQ